MPVEGGGQIVRFLPLAEARARPPAGSNRNWKSLQDHLEGTARKAAEFGASFGSAAPAYLAGLLHDLGKTNAAFKAYLERNYPERHPERGPPHAIWGAALAHSAYGSNMRLAAGICLSILGHHAGLKNLGDAKQRLLAHHAQHRVLMPHMSSSIPHPPERDMHVAQLGSQVGAGATDLWTRFLFSCLVDADRLDAREHERGPIERQPAQMSRLLNRLLANQASLNAANEDEPSAGRRRMNAVRRRVYEDCLAAAKEAPGFFRLTVPTGGGKTRSSLAFALQHAVHHGLRRVFIVVPFTTIIDQNADDYRTILGHDAILEHHSQVREEILNERHDETGCTNAMGLAAENWDIPVVVTTSVQFFETLFGDHPSTLRKLHNVANSVVVLDEIQAFPPHLLDPTLRVLRDLRDHYGVTVVFCTATQPAFQSLPEAFRVESREICSDTASLFSELSRVDYVHEPTPTSWAALAARLKTESQALVVLNTRRQATDLLQELQRYDGGNLRHLSTLLCAEHRRHVVADVKQLLQDGTPFLLVSTQVVEAGVDLDFPVVYRARGPMDRIIQAAGRCNREGRLEKGRVVIFEPEETKGPGGAYRSGTGLAGKYLQQYGVAALDNPELLESYFRELFSEMGPEGLDGNRIQPMREDLLFEEVAQTYRLIDQDTVPVVVDYNNKGARLGRAWSENPSLEAWRRVQPYLIQMYRYEAKSAEADGWLEPLSENVRLWRGTYDNLIGVQRGVRDTTDLVR
jgi:CRISPR-associated endonuclease/helicase Cas3